MLRDADPNHLAGIYIVCGYTALCYSIDSLAAIIEQKYHMNLFVSNTLFLFCGESASRIKGLLWEGDGFLLLYKRVENGTVSLADVWFLHRPGHSGCFTKAFCLILLCKTENFFLCLSHLFQSAMHSFRRLQYCVSAVFKALHGIFLSLFISDLRLLITSLTPFQT